MQCFLKINLKETFNFFFFSKLIKYIFEPKDIGYKGEKGRYIFKLAYQLKMTKTTYKSIVAFDIFVFHLFIYLLST